MNRFELRQQLEAEKAEAVGKLNATNRELVDVNHQMVGLKKIIDSHPISEDKIAEAQRNGIAVWPPQIDADTVVNDVLRPGNLILKGPRVELALGDPTPLMTRKMSSPLPNSPLASPTIDSVLVKAQNVHDYFMKHHKEHGWMELTPFSCAKPPYPRMVFSYDHVLYKDIKDAMLKISTESILQVDVEIKGAPTVLRHVDVGAETASEEVLRRMRVNKVSFYEVLGEIPNLDRSKEELFSTILDEVQPHGIISFEVALDGQVLPGHMYVLLSETGQVLTWRGIAHVFIRTPSERALIDAAGIPHEHLSAAYQRHTAIAMAAINFMNCRNVEVVDNAPSRQQRRHAEQHGVRPPVTYKTLVIHPVGKRRVKAAPGAPTGEEKALHICRGHFKDYRQGTGLGRWHRHGVWWWAPQVRGQAERGRVVKDYDVEVDE